MNTHNKENVCPRLRHFLNEKGFKKKSINNENKNDEDDIFYSSLSVLRVRKAIRFY